MEVSTMGGMTPMRLLGPIHALDGRRSHSLSSVRRTSKNSLLLFIHRNRYPSLHSQYPNWRLGQSCAASLKEVNEEDQPTQRNTWKKQAPTAEGAFKYPARRQISEREFPWRAAEKEPSNGRRSYSLRSSVQDMQSDPSTRISKNEPGSGAATERRNLNSRNSNGLSSSTRRGDEAGGRDDTNSNDLPRSISSRFSQYDTGRCMHRAPWEQGSRRAATANSRDIRSPPPMKRISERGEADGMEELDSRSGERNYYQDGVQKSAMARIGEQLRAVGNDNSASLMDFNKTRPATETSIFLPRPGQCGPFRRWMTSDLPMPKRASDDLGQRVLSGRFPWEKDDDEGEDEKIKRKKEVEMKPPSMAELTIPTPELKRLRTLGLRMHGRLKVGRLGVTPGIVEAIHNRWRSCEIAKVRCALPLSINMKKAHEDLEGLTGGIVTWRSGASAHVYRGKDYVHPFTREREEKEERERRKLLSLGLDEDDEKEQVTEVLDAEMIEEMELLEEKEDLDSTEDLTVETASLDGSEKRLSAKEKLDADLMMMEEILEGLGPRYEDWTGRRPIPVDADLLLSPDFEFKRPFRLLPYGVKPKPSNLEQTELRRLARPKPIHFVLGKDRGLGGLAAAIVKFWEKSEIVKIGVKRGVENTSIELMAEELRRLTGGTLLARHEEYIMFSRGKNFMPPAVQVALEERAKALQEDEDRLRIGGRKRALEVVEPSKAGTLEETMETRAAWESWQISDEARIERIAAQKTKRSEATDRIRLKMKIALQKKERAQVELASIDAEKNPAGAPLDKEHLSDGERYMYREVGLKMKVVILLGKRGVFGSTIERMHEQWKYREVVKIFVKAPLPEPEAQRIGKMLENGSGGILVDIVTTSKGQAMIVYRGKNYQRPPELRPRHLLTRRQALKRSLEIQRMQSLEKHIALLETEIQTMQSGLSEMEEEYMSKDEVQRGNKLEEFVDDELEYDDEHSVYGVGKPKKGSYFQAEPLTRKQRHFLRQQIPLIVGRTASFNIGPIATPLLIIQHRQLFHSAICDAGKSTVFEGLAKSICRFFEKHPFAKIGVKGRPKGTPVASVVEQIEESTGDVLLCTEPSKLIFYRGWPAGEERPDLAGLNEKESEQASGFEAGSAEENNTTDDDVFSIDAWNEEDWEEADEDDDEDEDEGVEFAAEEEEALDDDAEGHWVSFSGEESDYTDTDADELAAALSQEDSGPYSNHKE